MHQSTALAGLLALARLGACAHAPQALSGPSGPPDLTQIPVTEAPNARLYADCIAQAAANGAYGRAHDDETEMVLFTCTGAPARAFFEGLAARAAQVGTLILADGNLLRSTNAVQRDLFGVDWCVQEAAGHRCVISLNAGDFIKP